MAQQKVELRKIRDFSDNINDTFLFIKQNFKPLLTCFLGIAGVFMLSGAIMNGLYQKQSGVIFENIFRGGRMAGTYSIFRGEYLLVLLLGWLNFNAMQTVIIAYMKVYNTKNGDTPTIEEVWQEFKRYFLLVSLYTIPLVLMIIIGTVLCIVPGVYLGVVLAPFPVIIIMEEESFGVAFNRCFTLIKENFWSSFGIYIVMYLIYIFSATIISVVIGAITGIIGWFSTHDLGSTIGIVTSIANIFSYVFFIVFYVSVVLNYFNLTERYDGTGILSRLGTLGETNIATEGRTEEQY
jgi:hypothetical protein